METWQVAEAVLLAVLVGAALPVLFQLRASLRAAQGLIERTGGRLEHVLDATSTTVDRLNRLTEGLEDRRRLESLMEAVDEVTRSIHQLRETVRTGAAIGAAVAPAVAAAISAWRSAPHDRTDGVLGAEESANGASAPPNVVEREEECHEP